MKTAIRLLGLDWVFLGRNKGFGEVVHFARFWINFLEFSGINWSISSRCNILIKYNDDLSIILICAEFNLVKNQLTGRKRISHYVGGGN